MSPSVENVDYIYYIKYDVDVILSRFRVLLL